MFNDDCKLFVAGLADGVTEESLKELFQSGGHSVVQVSIPRDRETGRVRGIAFLTMATADDAGAVREGLDGSLYMGRTLLVRPYEREAPKRSERGPNGPTSEGTRGPYSNPNGPASAGPRSTASPTDRQIYIGNLPYDCSTEEVETLVNGLGGGQVQRVHLPTDPDGRKRGFGFVTMGSAEDAKTAVDGLATADLRGRRVNAKLAQPKAERPAPREGGYNGGGFNGPASSSFAGGGGGGGFGGPPSAGGPAPAKRPDDKRKKTGNSWDDGPRKPRFAGGATGGGAGKSRGGWSGGDDDE